MNRDAPSRAAPGRSPGALDPTDEELMARFRDGEAAAFDELIDRHRRPLFGYLHRSLRDPAEAEDLFQDVFLRVIRAAPSWKPSASFRTWLYTIARNALIDAARRRAAGPRLVALEAAPGGDPEAPSPLQILADPAPRPDEIADAREHEGAVEALVAALPPEQRESFLLKREGLTFEEIGAVAGCSRNTVKSRLRYALEKIRAGLVQGGLLDAVPCPGGRERT